MSGIELRHARIVLLKATHWPYVAAIYAFEALKQRFNLGNDEQDLFAARSRSYRRPLIAGRNNPTPEASRLSKARTRSEASLPMKRAAYESRTSHADSSDYVGEIRQLKTMIEKLSMQETLVDRLRTQESTIEKLGAQVEELTRRLAKPEDGQT